MKKVVPLPEIIAKFEFYIVVLLSNFEQVIEWDFTLQQIVQLLMIL